jgi:A/G-specific adenine glycosylase
MDLGATICTPKEPQCSQCPLRYLCKGNASGDPERFPTKTLKKKIPHIEAISAVILKKGRVLLQQRPPKGLLGGLWEFPNWPIEEKERSRARLRFRLRNYVKKEMRMTAEVKEFIGTFKQTFSHFKLTLHVFHCQYLNGKAKGKWVPVGNLPLLPMSRLHRRITEVIDGKTRG